IITPEKLFGPGSPAGGPLTLGPIEIMSGFMNLLSQRPPLLWGQARRTTIFFALTGFLRSTLARRQVARALRPGLLLTALGGRRRRARLRHAKQN
ncbi:MAG: hypothetical protein ACKOAO_08690, partial [Oxalobacteraceae bacterium]